MYLKSAADSMKERIEAGVNLKDWYFFKTENFNDQKCY